MDLHQESEKEWTGELPLETWDGNCEKEKAELYILYLLSSGDEQHCSHCLKGVISALFIHCEQEVYL